MAGAALKASVRGVDNAAVATAAAATACMVVFGAAAACAFGAAAMVTAFGTVTARASMAASGSVLLQQQQEHQQEQQQFDFHFCIQSLYYKFDSEFNSFVATCHYIWYCIHPTGKKGYQEYVTKILVLILKKL